MEPIRNSIKEKISGTILDTEGISDETVELLLVFYEGRKRYTGEPYLEYVSDMAFRLSEYKVDRTSFLAAFFWNAVSFDKNNSIILEKKFGQEVADLSLRMAKLSSINLKSAEETAKEKIRRLILALAGDIRVVFLRLLDRAHVLSKINKYPSHDPLINAAIAREVYAPLANRLGIGRLRSELEENSLKLLKPDLYKEISEKVKDRSNHHEMNVERIKNKIRHLLTQNHVDAQVKGRIKTVNSIFKKMIAQSIDFEDVYDVIGLRIITSNEKVQDCYAVLGLIHSLWKPIPHRFKDFIAVPKDNGYQSVHTSVIGTDGTPIEFQIRTEKMDYIAEVGLAAHWRYKETGSDDGIEQQEKFSWMRKVMKYLTEEQTSSDVVELFKVDLFPSEVYVFTPNGDVKSLPAGSTVVDFAFSIHSEVGFTCRHGKINNRLVPLKTKLKNGDIVEIITTRNSHPHGDWLKFVRTSTARNKIRSYLREQARDSMIKTGMDNLKKEFKKHRIPLKGLFDSTEFLEVVDRSGFKNIDDLFAAIGFNEFSTQHVINRYITATAALTQESQEEKQDQQPEQSTGMIVKVLPGVNIDTKFARCCEPEPGEKIVGYITHGRGITIHRATCSNLKKLESDRIISVSWDEKDKPVYPVRVIFEGYQSDTLIQDVTRVLVERKVVIQSQKIETVDRKKLRVKGTLLLELESTSDVEQILAALKSINSIKKATHYPSRRKKR